MLAALGRFTVRHRWLVVVAWVAATVALVVGLPSLASVEKSSNSQYLPATAPSSRATALAAPFAPAAASPAVLVAAATSGPLTAADNAAVARVEAAIRALPRVTAVRDQGASADGRARTAMVELAARAPSSAPSVKQTVTAIRSTFPASVKAPGLELHLTGPVAQSVDQQAGASRTQTLTELLSVIFIVLLLLLTFRSLLAPVVALLPSIVALFAAGPVIAASSHLGIQVSDLTPVLLTVILLGAGTDYGLFLIFRVREEIRRGRAPRDAVAFSLARVGESITFSALTVMAALATVAISAFGLYRGLGPALAIGIGVALVANLTLLPALLAIFGRAVFWPRVPAAGQPTRGLWGRTAARIVCRPVATLLLGLTLLGGLSLAMLAYSPAGFGDQAPPATSDSARGQAVLAAHFPGAEAHPTDVLFRLPAPVWDRPAALATAASGLRSGGAFSVVTGALDATGASLSPTELARAHTELAPYGPAADLPPAPPPGVTLPVGVYDAYHASAQYVSPDGRTVLFRTRLAAGPASSPAAAHAIPGARAEAAAVGRTIGATASGVGGYAAVAADVGAVSGNDLVRIIPIVLLVLGVLLAMVLRSLVAPLYLVASVGLSYLASLGLAVLVFVLIGGHGGVNFVLPFFMFIFIMALGQDYNILVMTRIREEAHHAPLREAVPRALEATGTTVTSAGLILAGTFGVLTATGSTQVKEIGLGLAAGILLDTFFVRTLIVPSVVVLLGRWNWWPSRLARDDQEHAPTRPGPKGDRGAPGPGPSGPAPGDDGGATPLVLLPTGGSRVRQPVGVDASA